MILQDKDLKHDDITHGFFSRKGGVSEGIYASLNCGLGTEDALDNVLENRRRAAEKVDVKPQNLLGLIQVHTSNCITVTEGWDNDNRHNGDAMVTDRPGFGLAILTADCAPVLFAGRKADKSPVIGAAHAGWQGVVKGVLESTCNEMLALGAVKSTIHASIGPCIGPKSYEVQESFKVPFQTKYTESDYYFHKAKKKGHVMFDLPGFIDRHLELMGIKSRGNCRKDTYALEDEYFSYRRTCHRKESDYGRQISIISIRDQ